jgi:6-phosphofructokinase 1
MNAALRGVARVAARVGADLVGVEEGYKGLLEGRFAPLDMRQLDDAARRGGTLLGTARSKRFPTEEGQAVARQALLDNKITGLVVIGGNGSLAGARALGGALAHDGKPVQIAGIPASIDNDLACTSMAIGVDTAMNTIVEACDRILDTATAHRRTFLVEVMGRECGYLAMTAGIAAGADCVLVRETDRSEDEIVAQVVQAIERAYQHEAGRNRVLVLKAEGVALDTQKLKEAVDRAVSARMPDVDSRVTVLGHVVRGGTPTAFDRLLGARLGNVALRALLEGQSDFMAGWFGPGSIGTPSPHDPYVVTTPLDVVLTETAKLLSGDSELARWRRKIYGEVETILAK